MILIRLSCYILRHLHLIPGTCYNILFIDFKFDKNMYLKKNVYHVLISNVYMQFIENEKLH